MTHRELFRCTLAAFALGVATQLSQAQAPADLGASLKALGRPADPASTIALFVPLLKTQSYAGVRISRDLNYGPGDSQRLDVFVPEAEHQSPRPVLIYVHGGGFVRGDKHAPGSPFYDNVMLWAARQGLIGVDLNHRMAPQNTWPAGTEDMGLAVRWVQENIAARGGDPKRVFLVGHSSGAVLAASYVAHPQYYGPAGVGLAGAVFLSSPIFDPATVETIPALKAYFGDDASLYAGRSSVPGLQRTPLPLMVATAEFDLAAVDHQARQLQDALCKVDRCPTSTRFPGHNHFSEAFSINSPDDTVGAGILEFIRGVR